MVSGQLEARGIEPEVLRAFRLVPRENFVPANVREWAYEDRPLPIAEGQTISQPYIVALTLQNLKVSPDSRVLEIGAGSGYAAAVLSRLVRRVVTVERVASLAEGARTKLGALGYNNIRVVLGDGSQGFAEEAPYDAIAVAAAAPSVPEALKRQLKVGGRLVIPVGEEQQQSLLLITRTGEETFVERDLGRVRFVPLIGEQGWLTAQLKFYQRRPLVGRARKLAHP